MLENGLASSLLLFTIPSGYIRRSTISLQRNTTEAFLSLQHWNGGIEEGELSAIFLVAPWGALHPVDLAHFRVETNSVRQDLHFGQDRRDILSKLEIHFRYRHKT